MNQQKLAKWKKWIGDANTDGTISRELSNLAAVRQVFDSVIKMVESNQAIQQHSAFYSVFALNYQHTVSMFVRRQVREDHDSGNLINLARDILENCGTITKDDFVRLFTRDFADEYDLELREQSGRSDFIKYFGDPEIPHLDPALMEADIADLRAIQNASGSCVDRRLAHLDLRKPQYDPTPEELENWCETLHAKFKRIYLILFATELQVAPVLQHDWKAIFRSPWLLDSTAM